MAERIKLFPKTITVAERMGYIARRIQTFGGYSGKPNIQVTIFGPDLDLASLRRNGTGSKGVDIYVSEEGVREIKLIPESNKDP